MNLAIDELRYLTFCLYSRVDFYSRFYKNTEFGDTPIEVTFHWICLIEFQDFDGDT